MLTTILSLELLTSCREARRSLCVVLQLDASSQMCGTVGFNS